MGTSTDGLPITPYLHSWAYEQGIKTKKYGYVAFFNGRSTTVWADTSYEAQQLAAAYFRVKKAHAVSVILAETNNQVVIHTAT